MRSNSARYSSRSPSFPRSTRSRKRRSAWIRLVLGIAVAVVALHQVRSALTQPQAVLVLGGATEREVFAAHFAHEHPNLPIWISSGSNPEYSEWVFSEAGIDANRIHRDYEALDTVSNFTTLVDDFKARDITSVYLITSDYHMRRARVIGEIVLGSQGIHFKAVPVPSQYPAEPLDKTVRDAARSMLWVATGNTGATLAKYFD